MERQVTVPDGIAIAEALGAAMGRAELIIVTGGLGPTSDDITREAVAEAFGKTLIFHQDILDGIAVKFSRRKLQMNDLQRPQAMVPEGGVILENANGTAPGLIVENRQDRRRPTARSAARTAADVGKRGPALAAEALRGPVAAGA